MISTRDLVGHGRFTLLTGIGGKRRWVFCRRASRRGDGRAGRRVQYRLGPRLRGYVLQLVRQAPGRGEGGRVRAAGSDGRVALPVGDDGEARGDTLTAVLKRVLGFEKGGAASL